MDKHILLFLINLFQSGGLAEYMPSSFTTAKGRSFLLNNFLIHFIYTKNNRIIPPNPIKAEFITTEFPTWNCKLSLIIIPK